MRYVALYVVAGLAAASAAFGQDDLYIAGTVVNSVTGEPIRGALVQLQCIQSEIPKNKAVVTETGGAFRISGLAAGSCFGGAQKPGFSVLRSGSEPVEVSRSVTDLVFRLEPLGKIFGRVTDGAGEPLSRAAIRLYAATIEQGRRVTKSVRSVNTDWAGNFRLWNLEPGDYYLLAAGRGGGTALVVAHTAPAPNSHESFAPVYYGGARDRDSATPLVLKAGQEVEANLSVVLRPAYRVRGRLRNARPQQPVQIELLRGGQDVSATRALVNAATGQFELEDVAPGAYTLRATQTRGGDPLRGEQDIVVGDNDLNGLTVDLMPRVEIAGHVQIQGARKPLWRGCVITLLAEEGTTTHAQQDAEGRFSIKVFPGRYRLGIDDVNAYPVSAVAGNVDLLATRALTVPPGGLPPLEIVMSADGGRLEVTHSAIAEREASVIIVPTGSGEIVAAGADFGPLGSPVLAPGDYDVFLVRSLAGLEYQNPTVVRALAGGVRVRVEKGQKATVELKEYAR